MWSLCSRRSEFSTAVMIHRRDDPSAGGTLLVRIATHRTGELRRKDHVVTASLQCPTDYLLRVFIAVSGVDEVDARVERVDRKSTPSELQSRQYLVCRLLL